LQTKALAALPHRAHPADVSSDDWLQYQQANGDSRRRAQEMDGIEAPMCWRRTITLRCCRKWLRSPAGRAVAIFWHIPWPNPEVLEFVVAARTIGRTTGADLIGFHTQNHCNNFLETVDRAVEALTEWDRFAVNRQGHVTLVRPFPISVAFPNGTPKKDWRSAGRGARHAVRRTGH